MDVKDLINFALSLREYLDEKTRATVVRRMVIAITESLKRNGDSKLMANWYRHGRHRFVIDCQVENERNTIAYDSVLRKGPLATFYDKWMKSSTFDHEGKKLPIPVTANAFRVSLLTDLRTLVDSAKI